MNEKTHIYALHSESKSKYLPHVFSEIKAEARENDASEVHILLSSLPWIQEN